MLLYNYSEAYKPCISKIRYSDISAVQNAKENLILKYRKLMKYYHCKFCDGFHLATK